MPFPAASTLTVAALTPLIAWRVYVRFKRASGRQRLSRYRGPVTLTLYALLVGLVAQANLQQPIRLLAFAAALGAGAGLAVHALRHTVFEPTRSGLYYTPHGPIGVSLAVVFVLRLAYRLVEVYAIDSAQPRSLGEFAQSPLTIAAFGLMAGYYGCYMLGLVRWRNRVLRAKRAREAGQDGA